MAGWLSVLAALAAALRELVRLFAGAADRLARREDAARAAKASAYDRLAKADRARQAVRDKLAAKRATSGQDNDAKLPEDDAGAPAAGTAGDDGVPDGLPGDKYRRK